MSLETLLSELQKIYQVHPNAGVQFLLESDGLVPDKTFEIGQVEYDHSTRNVLIEP